MKGHVRWRKALAALLGAVSVGAAVAGGVQAVGPGTTPAVVGPAPVRGSLLPGASDPDALVPPAGATVRPPVFAPSPVVPRPAPTASSAADPASRDGDPDDPSVDDPGRTAGSGETQFDWGCRRGYITQGC